MWRWLAVLAGAVLTGAVLVACGGGDPASPPIDDGPPAPSLAETSSFELVDPVDLDTVDFAAQVHWRADDFGSWVADPPSDAQKQSS